MEGTIGEVRLFAGTFAPRNWSDCDGSVIPIAENQALFSILGVTYGGDGRTSFALPKISALGAQEGAGVRYVICLQGLFPNRH